MKKNLLNHLFIALTIFFLVLSPVLVHAEDDGNERESEDSRNDNQPVVTPVEVPTEQPAVTPPVEETPALVPAPKASTTVEQVQTINKLVTRTIVPPIIVRDDNQNGIVDDIEQFYLK